MFTALLQNQIQKSLTGLPVSVTWRGERIAGNADARVTIHARDAKVLGILAKPTLGGLARAYVENWVDLQGSAQDILSLGQAYCGVDASQDAETRKDWRWWRHTRADDRRNINYHYDVSNDFYGLWLDSRRVYSCAYFAQGDESLDQAQEKKLDHICRKLMLRPGERLLDIGCGWGGLVLHAVERYGVKAVGITLSNDQHAYVQNLIQERGLQDRLEVRLMDYRDLPSNETFDKIASVGMFEHVGRKNLRLYFDKIYHLLNTGGLVMNHGITSVAVKSSGLGSDIAEFVDNYVFPGGELTHISNVLAELSQSGLEPLDAENLRPHYGKTLWQWVQRLEARQEQALEMIGERKYRIWRIYMAGSAFAFDHNWLALFQIVAGKPDSQGHLDYPYNRSHIYR
ncbi:cyclopropane-fatty-acyl-phospholipid synthase [Methylobacillus rhizosphaerae]|uniref:Cyclopropane-fatty-acyl-phospholipid synthase n=1 Tax=Methylobacillus rhizosphaerae TaxID=551994 RepID=A0A238YIB0_9PROT|nr:class I SAM-dependent methyltransferase [Methylobacillus rhizosphaerae]SNR70810.1 cyclopropane-fatty-acyl-phospholipid synthase [Methylobacillus rhizosphaerae]